MKYLQTYENFKPIKINSEKPFKIKKNILKHLNTFQKGIKIAKKKLDKEKNTLARSKIHQDITDKIRKIRDLNRHKLKQAEYLRNNPPKDKKKKELANFVYVYPTFIDYKRVEYNLFEYAIHFNNSVLEWFKTFEFQKWFIEDYVNEVVKDPKVYSYKMLQKHKIINTQTIKEYEYLVDAEKYNL